MQNQDNKDLNLNNKKEIIEEVSSNGYSLSLVPLIFKDDFDVVYSAVSNYGGALKFASPRLRSDRKIVLEAVKNYGEAIEYASPYFDDDREIVTTAFENKPYEDYFSESIVYSCMSKRLRNSSSVLGGKRGSFLERVVSYFSGEYHEVLKRREENWQSKYAVINKKRLDQWNRDVEDWKEKQKAFRYESYLALRKQIEQIPIHKRWRQSVIDKCGNMCQMCGADKKLEVHHRDSFYSIIKKNNITTIEKAFECKLLWNTENGEVLCEGCHDKMESSKKRQAVLISKGKAI
ncbi:MAG: DUF4116 domain-containing protein [bacterium]